MKNIFVTKTLYLSLIFVCIILYGCSTAPQKSSREAFLEIYNNHNLTGEEFEQRYSGFSVRYSGSIESKYIKQVIELNEIEKNFNSVNFEDELKNIIGVNNDIKSLVNSDSSFIPSYIFRVSNSFVPTTLYGEELTKSKIDGIIYDYNVIKNHTGFILKSNNLLKLSGFVNYLSGIKDNVLTINEMISSSKIDGYVYTQCSNIYMIFFQLYPGAFYGSYYNNDKYYGFDYKCYIDPKNTNNLGIRLFMEKNKYGEELYKKFRMGEKGINNSHILKLKQGVDLQFIIVDVIDIANL